MVICRRYLAAIPLMLMACTTGSTYDVLDEYEELDATTEVDAPSPIPGSYSPDNRDAIEQGKYMVGLLGCGVCHTDGALAGAPDREKPLAGSRTGIAYTNPLEYHEPGVVYPPNITPDEETGIGRWSDDQIALAIRAGLSIHIGSPITVMPWQGYSALRDDDVKAVVAYLRSIKPVRHRVPAKVQPGSKAIEPFVYFGVYQDRKDQARD